MSKERVNRSKAFGFGILADVAFGLFSVIWVWISLWFANKHPLSVFLATTSLQMVNSNPDLLPNDSVLYTGIATYLFLTIFGFVVIIIAFILIRYLLYTYVLNQTRSVRRFNQVCWRNIFGFFLLPLPGLLVITVLAMLVNLVFGFFTFVTTWTVFSYISATLALYLVSLFMILCVLYFYHSIHYSILESFTRTIKLYGARIGNVLLLALYITVASLLFQLIGSYVLANIFTAGSWIWYTLTSLVLISWLRAQTLYFA